MSHILITGASGQLGTACAIQFASTNPVLLTHHDCDITNSTQVNEVLTKHSPDIVIHCAAYTNVRNAQTEPHLAHATNTIGTYNLLRNIKPETLFIHISTDYVFDGTKQSPYTETDLPHPQTVYGSSKYAAELLVQDIAKNFLILRTAWVFGDSAKSPNGGKNFVQTMLTLAKTKDTLTVVNDQIGCPTYTKDLAQWIDQLIQANARGIYHTVNDGHCSWAQFAQEIMKLKSPHTTIKPVTTEEFAQISQDFTPRPKYSVLDNSKLKGVITTIRPWQESLKAYLT